MGVPKTKITLNGWKVLAQQEGYQILSTQYVDSRTHLEILCPKNHKWQCNWNNWKQGHRCKLCYFGKPKRTKHNVKKIKQYCAREGYRVSIIKYTNPHDCLTFICPKGHSYKAMWMQFYRGERCKQCRFEVMNIQKVRAVLEKEGYLLISTAYKNSHSKLDSFCLRGHRHNFAWSEFKKGYRCLVCARSKTISRGEKRLGEIISVLFSKENIKCQDNLGFLKRQTVDYSVPALRLAFEFDGEHHFRPTTYGGMSSEQASQLFKIQQERDVRKDKLCKANGIRLIKIAYTEPLTLESVQEKIGVHNV